MKKQWERREILKALAVASAYSTLGSGGLAWAQAADIATLILKNGKVTTLDGARPNVSAVAIAGGRFAAVGDEAEILKLAGPTTRVIDVGGRRVIPGLMDSHTHPIRGGLNYNLELRWDGVPSLAEGMRMLKAQAQRTPAPQWVRVVGGFNEYQFAEKRLPTLKELNEAAPATPVFMLAVALVLVIVGALVAIFPRLAAYPIAAVAIWIGGALFYRSYRLRRSADRDQRQRVSGSSATVHHSRMH